MLHAHIIAIKSNTFFWNVQPTKSIYWAHACQVLEKVPRVIKEKHKASASCGGHTPIPASPFPGLYCNYFYLRSTKGTCFLDLSSTRANSYILSPNITPVILTCSSAGNNLISEERRVFTRISWKFLLHSLLHQLTCGFIHSQHSSLELGPMQLCYLPSHPHSQQRENRRSRSSSFPDTPALFTPPKSFKIQYSQTPRSLLYEK